MIISSRLLNLGLRVFRRRRLQGIEHEVTAEATVALDDAV